MIITLSVMTNRGAETDSYQPMRYPSDESLPSGASVGPVQHQHLLQVVADPFQPEMTSVSHLTEIATARHPLVALQSANDPLHCPTNAGEEPIPPFLPGGHGPIAPGPVDDAAKHSPAAQPRLAAKRAKRRERYGKNKDRINARRRETYALKNSTNTCTSIPFSKSYAFAIEISS